MLPFLVTHGWWISKLITVLLATVLTIVVVSLRRARADRPTRLFCIATFVTCALASYVGGCSLGAHLVRDAASQDTSSRMAKRLSSTHPLAIAAALPGSRGIALEELEHHLRMFVGPSDDAVRQRASLALLRHGCVGMVRSFIADASYVDALAAARNCNAGMQVDTLLLVGRYDEASRIATRENASDEQRVLMMIATRRWSEAARIVEESRTDLHSASRARCVADLFRWFGGDQTVTSDISDAANDSGACAIAAALVSSEQRGRLEATSRTLRPRPGTGTPVDLHSDAAQHIAWMYGAMIEDHGEFVYALSSTQWIAVEPWLAHIARDANDADAAVAWSVAREIYFGDFATARATLAVLRSRPSVVTDPRFDHVDGLDLALQLREGRLLGEGAVDVHVGVRDHVAMRRGDITSWLSRGKPVVATRECEKDVASAFESAATGNGDALADLVEDCRVYSTVAPALLAVAPRIHEHRERLAATTRAVFVNDTAVDRRIPFELVHQLAWMRDLARVTGAVAEADRLQGMVERHLTAFRDREQLVALLMWRGLGS